ncbi:hypothetical protein BGP_2677 [Beggiatoa sp. PS]|nr:hypothetical protein BGP_2677 [Beggiatoa sp. PS]
MNTTRQAQAEQKKQTYLKRVNLLFDNVKQWLKDEPILVEESTREINETLMEDDIRDIYTAPMLGLYTQNHEKVVDLKPVGASVIIAKGMIDIEDPYGDREHITYMLKEQPLVLRKIGDQLVEKPRYNNVNTDNWYWLNEGDRHNAQVMNPNLLRKLIMRVSDYEF